MFSILYLMKTPFIGGFDIFHKKIIVFDVHSMKLFSRAKIGPNNFNTWLVEGYFDIKKTTIEHNFVIFELFIKVFYIPRVLDEMISVWGSYFLYFYRLRLSRVCIATLSAHKVNRYGGRGQPWLLWDKLGTVSIWRCRLTSIGIPMLKIRRSRDHLIFNIGIPIPKKDGLYIESGPWSFLAWGNITATSVYGKC